MDLDFLLVVIMVITTTAIGFIGANAIVGKVLDYKRDKAGIPRYGSPTNRALNEDSERRDMIEDRLAVLERLATDRGQLLSDEIEALRGPAALEATIEDQKSEVQ